MVFNPSAPVYTQGFGSLPANAVTNVVFQNRAPTAQDVNYALGTRWIYIGSGEYVLLSQSSSGGTLTSNWSSPEGQPASNTNLGVVYLATTAQTEAGTAPSAQYVSSANDVFAYGQSLVLAGANIAQTTVTGITNLATNAQAVAGTATVPGVTALAVQPSNLSAVFASPPAIGGTASAAGTFTTLTSVGTTSINASGTAATTIGGSSGLITIASGSGGITATGGGNTIQLFNDAAANVVTLGSTTGAASLNLQAGTGNFVITTAATTTITVGAAQTSGTITIGGTAATGTITLGSSSGTSIVAIA